MLTVDAQFLRLLDIEDSSLLIAWWLEALKCTLTQQVEVMKRSYFAVRSSSALVEDVANFDFVLGPKSNWEAPAVLQLESNVQTECICTKTACRLAWLLPYNPCEVLGESIAQTLSSKGYVVLKVRLHKLQRCERSRQAFMAEDDVANALDTVQRLEVEDNFNRIATEFEPGYYGKDLCSITGKESRLCLCLKDGAAKSMFFDSGGLVCRMDSQAHEERVVKATSTDSG
eukprot:1154636-Amphidinium_carterae.3